MNRIPLILTVLGLAGGLAACGQQPAEEAREATPADQSAAAGSKMPGMDMPAGSKMAKGTGTVTAVDPQAGTVTIDHQPIPEANWPAMSMAFKASPELVQQVKPGDKVAFDLKLEGGSGELTAVQKQ